MAEKQFLEIFEGADYQFTNQADFAKYQREVAVKINRYGVEKVRQAYQQLMTKYLEAGKSLSRSERVALCQAYIALQYLPQYPQLVELFNENIISFTKQYYEASAVKILTNLGLDARFWTPAVIEMVASRIAQPLTMLELPILNKAELYQYLVQVCTRASQS